MIWEKLGNITIRIPVAILPMKPIVKFPLTVILTEISTFHPFTDMGETRQYHHSNPCSHIKPIKPIIRFPLSAILTKIPTFYPFSLQSFAPSVKWEKLHNITIRIPVAILPMLPIIRFPLSAILTELAYVPNVKSSTCDLNYDLIYGPQWPRRKSAIGTLESQ